MPRYPFRYPYHKSLPAEVREDIGRQVDAAGAPWNRNWGEPDYTKGIAPAEIGQELAEHSSSRSFPTPEAWEIQQALSLAPGPHVRVRRQRL